MRILRSMFLLGAVGIAACGADPDEGDFGDAGPSNGRSGDADSPSGSGGNGDNGGNGGDDGNGDDGIDYESDGGGGTKAPPPVITGISPLEGDYGAEVTVTGDNLNPSSAALILDTPAAPLKIDIPKDTTNPNPIVVKWTKTEIRFKYPFPAEGAVRVSTSSGQATGGTFAPSVRPGSPIAGTFARRDLLGFVSPAAGTIVGIFDGDLGPRVLVGRPDGSVQVRTFTRGASALQRMGVYATAQGTVEGFFVGGGKLWQLKDAAGTPSATDTGVAAVDAAGGVDGTGTYAWIDKGNGQLARVRPPSWAESATVTDPRASSAPGRSMSLGADQTLYVGWGYNSGGSFPLYDNVAYPLVRRLRPGQTSFDAQRTMSPAVDDKMLWTRIVGGPNGRVWAYYCGKDTGVGSPTIDCAESYLDAGTPRPGSDVVSQYVVGFGATTAFAAACEKDTSTLKFGPEEQTAQQAPLLFPCPNVVGVAVDPQGAGVMLVEAGGYVYAPTKR